MSVLAASLPVSTPPAAASPDRVSVLDADEAFWSAVPADDRVLARRVLSAERRDLAVGPWNPAQADDGGHPFAALVIDGVIMHEVLLADRVSAQLLGAGDVLRPWTQGDTELPCSTRWTTVASAAVVVLDDRFLAAARRWPDLIVAMHARLSDQLDSAARHAAICGLGRVEDRALALFWHLADRWGVVRPDGVAVRIPLTHELIGRMIAAKRPTVSLALTGLAAAGFLERTPGNTWTLSHDSRAVLAREAPGLRALQG